MVRISREVLQYFVNIAFLLDSTKVRLHKNQPMIDAHLNRYLGVLTALSMLHPLPILLFATRVLIYATTTNVPMYGNVSTMRQIFLLVNVIPVAVIGSHR